MFSQRHGWLLRQTLQKSRFRHLPWEVVQESPTTSPVMPPLPTSLLTSAPTHDHCTALAPWDGTGHHRLFPTPPLPSPSGARACCSPLHSTPLHSTPPEQLWCDAIQCNAITTVVLRSTSHHPPSSSDRFLWIIEYYRMYVFYNKQSLTYSRDPSIHPSIHSWSSFPRRTLVMPIHKQSKAEQMRDVPTPNEVSPPSWVSRSFPGLAGVWIDASKILRSPREAEPYTVCYTGPTPNWVYLGQSCTWVHAPSASVYSMQHVMLCYVMLCCVVFTNSLWSHALAVPTPTALGR